MEIKNHNWTERTRLLYGDEQVHDLHTKHVLIVGLGGVGGYAAEMLARAGIGFMTIVDADIVQPSNINRQIVALHSSISRPKASALAERLRDINPEIELEVVEEFLKDDNMIDLLQRRQYDYVIDAIDSLSPKVHLIAHTLKLGYPLVSSMGAGAKRDPMAVRVADISRSRNCSLARALRKRLRKLGINKGVSVIYSEELPDERAVVEIQGERCKRSTAGTVSYMPAIFGCHLAAHVLSKLIPQDV